MDSSSFTSSIKEDVLHTLELECHYLTRALSKLERHSPEWKYMLHRLEMANKELGDEMRRREHEEKNEDEEAAATATIPPATSSSHLSASPSLPTGGRYVINISPDHDHRGYNNTAKMTDGEDRSASNTMFYNRNGPAKEDEEGGCAIAVVSPLQDDNEEEDDASFAPFVMRNEDSSIFTPRRKLQTCLRYSLLSIMLITGILLVALNIGKPSTTTKTYLSDAMTIDSDTTDDDGQQQSNKITEPCASFTMRLIPDRFGNETTWKVLRYDAYDGGLRNSSDHNFTVVFSGGPYLYKSEIVYQELEVAQYGSGAIVAKTCLPAGAYKFIIYDVRGDGICCDYGRGEYGVTLSKGRVIHPLSSISFSSEREATSFLVAEDDIDVYPAAASMTTALPNDGGVDDALDDSITSVYDAQNSIDESGVDTIAVDPYGSYDENSLDESGVDIIAVDPHGSDDAQNSLDESGVDIVAVDTHVSIYIFSLPIHLCNKMLRSLTFNLLIGAGIH